MKQFPAAPSRRNVLRWIGSAASFRLLMQGSSSRAFSIANASKPSSDAAGFEPTNEGFPGIGLCSRQPGVVPPKGSSESVFDIFGNYWSLAKPDQHGSRKLLVLPAQSPQRWVEEGLSSLSPGPWQYLGADEFGYIWIADKRRCFRLDPHTPQAGWTDFTTDLFGALIAKYAVDHDATITAMGTSGEGAIAVALDTPESGAVVELDRDQRTSARMAPAPAGIDCILCDGRGDLWLRTAKTSYRKAAARDAWQRRWEMVDRLSAGDHDLSGDVLNGKFYMAGGQNAGWGYPALPHVFNNLLAFDPETTRWNNVAQLDQPRYYNGTSYLDDRIWIIAGYTRDEKYNPVRLDTVEIWDPITSRFSYGPSLPISLDNPLAMHANGRIYVAGCVLATNSSPLKGPLQPCLLLSIGVGETAWRREPDGPAFLLALAGTVLGSDLYFALAGKGLGRYDTTTRIWSVIPVAHAARSPQMAAFNKEIWIMGGRDIEHQDAITIYSPATDTWRSGPNLPRPLAWGAATEIGGRLMVVGGAAGRGYNNRTFLLRDPPLTGA